MTDKTLGVIVGRFQVDKLHEGHLSLIRYVAERHSSVLILIGTAPTRVTDTDPLDLRTREGLFNLDLFPPNATYIKVWEIPDHSSDKVWSQQLDARVSFVCNGGQSNAVLYGSRDSFLKAYSGNYPTHIVPEVPAPSGTQVREELGLLPRNSEDFRAGVIYASQQRFPTSFQTVDIAILDTLARGPRKRQVLLGRKPGATEWRFPGGFVDPEDPHLEWAARREAQEETSLNVRNVQYLDSFRVDDPRYRRSKDKIMTAFFIAEGTPTHELAGDDLEEVRWFDIDQLSLDSVVDTHYILAHRLKAYVAKLDAKS